MPGTPDPVLGSQPLTHAVASLVGLALVATVYATRKRIARDRLLPALIGAVFAATTLGMWAAARVVTGAMRDTGFTEHPLATAGILVFSFLVLAGFVFVTVRLFARRGLVVPLVGLFLVTEPVWWAFLHVRGETDALGMFVMFGPLLVVVVLLFTGVEYAGRRLWARLSDESGRSTV